MWIASNLSVPFWMVGHVHLTMNVYEDIHEIIASFGMNLLEGSNGSRVSTVSNSLCTKLNGITAINSIVSNGPIYIQ